MDDDRYAIQCNYAVATTIATEGARAYMCDDNPGWGHERVRVLVRSRGGRWVDKWVAVTQLKDFRVKTLPPDHPLYGDRRIRDGGREAMTQLAVELATTVDDRN